MDWVRIEAVELDMDAETAKSFSVVMGQDLQDWATAYQERLAMDKHNRELAQIAIGSAGALAALTGASKSNNSLAYAGLGTMAAADIRAVSDVINGSRSAAMNPKFIPDQHLYHPFSVPGTMFLRRWVLVNKPADKMIKVLALKVKTVDGRVCHLAVKIN